MRVSPRDPRRHRRVVGSHGDRTNYRQLAVECRQIRRWAPDRGLGLVLGLALGFARAPERDAHGARLRRGHLGGQSRSNLRAFRTRGGPPWHAAWVWPRPLDHEGARGGPRGPNRRRERARCRFDLHGDASSGDTRRSTMSSHEFVQPLARFTSGVAGLDRVLNGGFFAGGVYIVEGIPGSGKTILANQICFHHVKKNRRVLYVTLLAESHARLLQHLQDLSFFDAAAIPDHLTYVSGFRALEDGGLKALLELVRKELRGRSAGLVVLDGLAAVGESAETDREFKKFVHELQVFAGLSSCTFFLLSSGSSSASRAAD